VLFIASAPVAANPDAPPHAVRVAAALLEPQPYAITLPEKVGILEAAASQSLAFEVAGRVERILGQGAQVEEGNEIAALESALEEAELRRARLLLRDAESEYARVRGLRESRATSQSAVDSARTAVGTRRAERDAAAERLARRRLNARFSGVVANVEVDPGEVATPGRAVAELLNFDLMKVEVNVAGYQIGSVRAGARVIVTIPALREREFVGHVPHVSPSAGEGAALFEVEILVPNGEALLKPGMSARTRIVTRNLESAVIVPLEAVVERADRRVVFFVEAGRARAVDLAEATLHGDRLILPGSLPYRQLVVRGQHDLQDGDPVSIDNRVLEGETSGRARLAVGVAGR
jgi:membrane fusion protein (multidrug efflux system)